MLNHKEVMEALLAGKVLVDTYDKTVKIRLKDSVLEILDGIKGWQTWIDDGITLLDWKLEPETININGHEVPKPITDKDQIIGNVYYVVATTQEHLHYAIGMHSTGALDEWIKRGIVHSTKENAIAHAKALLSFTKEGTSHDN